MWSYCSLSLVYLQVLSSKRLWGKIGLHGSWAVWYSIGTSTKTGNISVVSDCNTTRVAITRVEILPVNYQIFGHFQGYRILSNTSSGIFGYFILSQVSVIISGPQCGLITCKIYFKNQLKNDYHYFKIRRE